MKHLGGAKGNTGAEMKLYYMLQAFNEKYSGHMKNRKSPTIIPNFRDKCPNLLLAKYNSVAVMGVCRLFK
jgi:hypothetical protein